MVYMWDKVLDYISYEQVILPKREVYVNFNKLGVYINSIPDMWEVQVYFTM